ncbi:MAG: hypothetical protein M3P48_01260 [Actinomycetota bacterium]|nr:hypothetical protein [Actinomycetota bacterium]
MRSVILPVGTLAAALLGAPVAGALPPAPAPVAAPASPVRAAGTGEDNVVPIIRGVRIRPATPVLKPSTTTTITVDVRVTDDSGVDGIEAWLHAWDGLDGREIKDFAQVPGRNGLYRASITVSNRVHAGAWNTDFFVSDNASNMALRRGKAPFRVKRDTRFQAFNVGPEPARRGARLTAGGELSRFDPEKGYVAYRGKRVQILFKRAKATKWISAGFATTDRAGRFSRAVKVAADGTWRAYFPGTDTYVARRSGRDAVDVR